MVAFSILIVDDEQVIRSGLKALLNSEGYEAEVAKDGLEGLELFKENQYTLVLSDINMPNMTGLELTKQVKLINPDTSVVLFTGYSSIESALEAMKSGAEEYLLKPINNDDVLNMVSRVHERWDLRATNEMLRQEVLRDESLDIIGNSKAIQKVKTAIEKVSDSDVPVLITGEAGTGKSIIARSIHNQGPRKSEAFVSINCSTITADQLKGDLFGYEAGATPGAITHKYGLLEVANGGTILLDEIGEMAMELQPTLLNAIETKQFLRLGAQKEVSSDFRLIASSTQNLLSLVEEGNFREDLYYLLSSASIDVPALRDRKEDIPLLVEYFKERNGRHDVGDDGDTEFLDALERYDWPGNQRELRHVLERVFLLVGDSSPTIDYLPPEIGDIDHQFSGGYKGDIERATLAQNERDYMLKTYRELGGNMTHVAKALGLNLKSLYERFEKAGLSYLYQKPTN